MDLQQYATHAIYQRRVLWTLWIAGAVLAVGCALLVGYLWTFAAGLPLGALIALLQWEATSRWSKRSWLKQFPELADPRVTWHHGSYVSSFTCPAGSTVAPRSEHKINRGAAVDFERRRGDV